MVWLFFHLTTSQELTWRRQWQPTPGLLPGKSHGPRSLVGCSPWGHEESIMTEELHFYFSLSCIGERNGNPLQCSCLENPRDSGAWWAAVYGVAQNQTRLKRLSSSSSSSRSWQPSAPPHPHILRFRVRGTSSVFKGPLYIHTWFQGARQTFHMAALKFSRAWSLMEA